MFLLTVLVCVSMTGIAIAQEEDATSNKKLVIQSKSGAKITVTKAEISRRERGRERALPSRRVAPPAKDPTPPVLRLTFPTLVYPGEDVKATLKFNDPDDYILTIYVTVFFPDGDVVTEALYDYRTDGDDIYKGTYKFWVEIPDSETPLPGTIVITASDDYLNVSQITHNFVMPF